MQQIHFIFTDNKREECPECNEFEVNCLAANDVDQKPETNNQSNQRSKLSRCNQEDQRENVMTPACFHHVISQPLFIAITGLIGAGKTTLADKLGELMNIQVYHEPVETNIYLEDYYKDMKRYGFAIFQQHQKILWSGKSAVQDRSIYEDSIFAKVLMKQGNMDVRDYETYKELYSNLSNFIRHPNFIVHLDVTAEVAAERIKMRDRSCECNIPMDYLQELHTQYEQFILDISKRIPVIRVNWSEFRSTDEVAEYVLSAFKNMTRIIDVDFNKPVDKSEVNEPEWSF